MNIWLVCQYFRPETNPPANRMLAFARNWQEMGAKVRMLTALPNHPKGELHPGYEDKPKWFLEEVEGVPVQRHWLWISKKKSAIPRALMQLSFMWSLIRYNKKKEVAEEDRPSVVVASSPEFFCVIGAWLLARRYGVPFVMEVRDLWPAIFKDMGVLTNPVIIWVLERIELFMYRRAAAVVTVTEGYARNIASRGIDAEKIFMIPNGVADFEMDTALEVYKSGAVEKLRSELQLNPLTKVVLYIGNHGQAQALGQVIDAARLLMHRTDIQFLMVGDGADRQRLQELGKGIPNLQFLGNQPKEKVWAFYGVADVSISCLKNVTAFDTTIPSKIFEIMSSKTPLVAGLRGEAAAIVEKSGGGVVVPPEAPEKMADVIVKILDDPSRMTQMATSGRAFAEKERRYSALAKQYAGVLQHVTVSAAADDAEAA